MMNRALTIVAILSLLAAAAGSASAGETCISDWSQAATVVRKEGLTTVEQLVKLAHKTGAGDIVRTTLCEDAGSYVYRLVVKDRNGQLKTLTVDARKPFAR